MFQALAPTATTQADFYATLQKQLASLLEGERDFVANAANFSAFIYVMLPDVNWAGCYLLRGNDLVLGPFQGKPACVRIAVWPEPRGVCGRAAYENKTQRVANVHDFPGHIACDAASNAEIVVPLLHQGKVFGVFDIDSPSVARFDEGDRVGIEALVSVFLSMTTLPGA